MDMDFEEDSMTKQEAHRLVELAQAGAPIPEGMMTVCLALAGEPVRWAWQDFVDANEFVDALRKEGLI